jgi:RNA polymerase sigma factor (sigma-70 family)
MTLQQLAAPGDARPAHDSDPAARQRLTGSSIAFLDERIAAVAPAPSGGPPRRSRLVRACKLAPAPAHAHERTEAPDQRLPAGPPERSQESDDALLADRIRAGDRAAESDLWIRYKDPVYCMLRRRTGDQKVAEDLRQETFLAVIQTLRGRGLRDGRKLSAYVLRTAKYICVAWLRKEARRNTTADTQVVETTGSCALEPASLLQKLRAEQAVAALLDELPMPRDRDILHRHYVLNETKPSICRDLQLDAVHFDRVICRARRRFREILQDLGVDVGDLTQIGDTWERAEA